MRYEIFANPTYSAIEIGLDASESVAAESGAMAWMTANVQTKTSTRGGVLKGLKRAFLAGESFFQNTYTASGGPGSVTFAPGASGDIDVVELDGSSELLLEKGAYLASSAGISCDSKFDGLRGLFNEGMFVLRCTGVGLLFFHSYGRLEEIDLDGQYIVDNGHAVAWEPSLSYKLARGKRIRSFLFSDQLILRFSGRGKLWVQSRSPPALASWVHPFRNVQSSNND